MELTNLHCDALCESMNIGVANAAQVLSTLVEKSVGLEIPQVEFIELDNLREHLDGNYAHWGSCVILQFDGGLKGDGVLVFSKESARYMVSLVGQGHLGDEVIPEMESDLLLELGNIIVNSCVGSIANLLEADTTDGFPRFCSRGGGEVFDELLEKDRRDTFGMIITTNMKIEGAEEVALDLIITFNKSCISFVLERLMALID